MPKIVRLSARAWNIELNQPFGIATGAQVVAANVLVEVQLADGTMGLGEAAPFPAVNGETQAAALAVLRSIEDRLVGRDSEAWEEIASDIQEGFHTNKSALCAVETALLDAHCKSQKVSLWWWAGGAQRELTTDITIPTGSVEAARTAALAAAAQGFHTLKIKVGGADLDLDINRILAVLTPLTSPQLIVDGNAALSASNAVTLIQSLGELAKRVVVFEQPTARDDLDALCEVRAKTGIKIAADESAGNADDVAHLARANAVDIVNIKIMKSGIAEALRMISVARQHGLGLMVGGMVESELAMTTSACIAAGIGGFSWVDLDTPLFMKGTPTRGGVRRSGAHIALDTTSFGHGVEPHP